MERTGLTKQQIISSLTKSVHGDLSQYHGDARTAARQDPDFYAHLCTWNADKGQIKDAKIALPLALLSTRPDAEHAECAAALIAMLEPRQLWKAVECSQGISIVTTKVGKKVTRTRTKTTPLVSAKLMHRLVARYLREREADPFGWDRNVVQFRSWMHRLYRWAHVMPGGRRDARESRILFHREYARGSVFEVIKHLGDMPLSAAVLAIREHRIPFLVALPLLGAKAKEADAIMTLLGAMSPTDVVTNAALLVKLGVKNHPTTRAALEEALEKIVASRKATFKTTRAAKATGGTTSAKLSAAQEKQLDAMAIEGDWLILGDKSGSMNESIELAKLAAGTLARASKGETHLVFFDSQPYYLDVTGRTMEEIVDATKYVHADGGTSIGCGVQYMLERRVAVDGIVIISDGAEHHAPSFVRMYQQYAEWLGKDVPVYFYRTHGEPNGLTADCNRAGIDVQTYELESEADYYSMPNVMATMRANRYSLLDEIMAMPLKTLDEVLPKTAGMRVLVSGQQLTGAWGV